MCLKENYQRVSWCWILLFLPCQGPKDLMRNSLCALYTNHLFFWLCQLVIHHNRLCGACAQFLLMEILWLILDTKIEPNLFNMVSWVQPLCCEVKFWCWLSPLSQLLSRAVSQPSYVPSRCLELNGRMVFLRCGVVFSAPALSGVKTMHALVQLQNYHYKTIK